MDHLQQNTTTPGDNNPASTITDPPAWHRFLGIGLAIGSAFFIGSSFVLKKRGLLDSNKAHNEKAGEGYGYLKNPLWWTGLILMLGGELCNMAAYAFSPAVLVTPLGAVSVVISAIMSDVFLKEKLNFSAKIGCAQCVLGATLLVMNCPANNVTTTLASFWKLVIDPVFQGYLLVNAAVLLFLIFYAANKWGSRWPMIYITICSLLGSFVVVSMQGLGSAVVYSASNPNDNQFKQWSMYPLIVFVVGSGVLQINYLNKALNIFSTAVVTPIYYVCFTTATLICSAVLFRDFNFASVVNGVSAGIGFLVIVGGVALLFAYSLKLTKTAELNLQDRTNGRSPSLRDSFRATFSPSSSNAIAASSTLRDRGYPTPRSSPQDYPQQIGSGMGRSHTSSTSGATVGANSNNGATYRPRRLPSTTSDEGITKQSEPQFGNSFAYGYNGDLGVTANTGVAAPRSTVTRQVAGLPSVGFPTYHSEPGAVWGSRQQGQQGQGHPLGGEGQDGFYIED
ncbi:hypothetical protein HDU76_008526, partial [Blyttiomyces sp. JEL0837]